jgi:transcriptional regulator with XRE-family HTH domain
MSTQSIGTLLRAKRVERNLTQTEVATELGLTQSAYSNIERGKARLNAKHLDDLQRVLGISPGAYIERFLDMATPTEREIATDILLKKDQRRLLLLIYGELTGRQNSVMVANWYGADGDDATAAPSP